MQLAPWRTVRGRLVLAALLIELVMLGILVGNSLRLLRQAMGEQAREHAEQMAPVLSAALVAPLAQFDVATVQAVLDESRATRGLSYLAVTDASGKVVASSGWLASKPLPAPDARFDLDIDEEEPRYDVVRPVRLAGQTLAMLHFGVDLSPIRIARANLLRQGLAIAGGEMLLSAGLLGVLGLLITRQLSKLTSAALQVAEGRQGIAAVPEGRDDVGRLGAAFNIMQRSIAERVHDLTRAKDEAAHMAATLRERGAQLDAIFALSPDGFVSFDSAGRVGFVNPAFCRMSGLAEHEVLGVDEATFSRRLARLCSPQSGFAGLAALRAASAEPCKPHAPQPRQQLELTGVGHRVLEMSLRQAGTPEVSLLLWFRDVTHEVEVDRMKSEFLSHAAHELRTPMASIFGFAELLKTRPVPDARRAEMLEIIHRQSIAMTKIIDELLDLARIDDRRGKDFHFQPVDIAELVRGVVADFGVPAGRQAPAAVLPGGLRAVRADPGKLEQAVRNLLSNAYKYSPDGGEVTVTVFDGDDGRIGVQVADEGMGMTAEQVSHVFERFYRADASGNIPGTGLGMAIVKEILELHGGEAVVNSIPAVGTTVTLWLKPITS